MFKEFKKFISRGNVIDLAVGVVVGGAFSSIVTSLVNDIIMPLIGLVVGGIDFTNLSYKGIMYGSFIQHVIDFLIISFCIFIVIKLMNNLSDFLKKEENKFKKNKKGETETKEEEAQSVSEEVLLLREISKELKKVNSTKKRGK